MLTRDRVAGVALVLFALFVLWESRRLPLGTLGNPGPAFMPVVLALLVLTMGALIAALGAGTPAVVTVGWREWGHAIAIFAVCAFAALALERLGYRATIALSLAFLVGVVERRGIALAAAFAVGLAGATHFLFDTLLRVPLPRGPFGL
ncbi:MAG: tripartite tricarboxylate transporter TctB family protein [Candidatus Rokubacteria bacterium]|nr:tripartite tricarboxylate transporter TctB family protein [Candidatus Rokubacteria bacterium]